MSAVMTRLSPANRLQLARKVAFRDFGEVINAMISEQILPRKLHWALCKLQPHQATTDKLSAVADALQQLPGLEKRYRLALELRQRQEAILPLLTDFRDQVPAALRGNVSYVLKVSPGLADNRARLFTYDETLSRLEKWVENRSQQVAHERRVRQVRKGSGVPSKCESFGCATPHANKRAHDMWFAAADACERKRMKK